MNKHADIQFLFWIFISVDKHPSSLTDIIMTDNLKVFYTMQGMLDIKQLICIQRLVLIFYCFSFDNLK